MNTTTSKYKILRVAGKVWLHAFCLLLIPLFMGHAIGEVIRMGMIFEAGVLGFGVVAFVITLAFKD